MTGSAARLSGVQASMLFPSAVCTGEASRVEFRWERLCGGGEGSEVKVAARAKGHLISTSQPTSVDACKAEILISADDPGIIGLCLESLEGLQLTPVLHVLALPGNIAHEVNNLFLKSVEDFQKHLWNNNPAAFLLREKDVESRAWNMHFHTMIIHIGEFLKAPGDLSPTVAENISNAMKFLVKNGVFPVAQYLLNTAISAGNTLMWNGVPIQHNGINLEEFFQSQRIA